jgi:hypothetical protein
MRDFWRRASRNANFFSIACDARDKKSSEKRAPTSDIDAENVRCSVRLQTGDACEFTRNATRTAPGTARASRGVDVAARGME